MKKGIVIWLDRQKGYGFIKKADGKEMLMHTKLMPRNRGVSLGDRVQFKSSSKHIGLATMVKVA